MMEIRARTTLARTLARTDNGTAIEIANYVIPTALLLTLALVRFMRRRQVAPLVGRVGSSGPVARTDKEARA